MGFSLAPYQGPAADLPEELELTTNGGVPSSDRESKVVELVREFTRNLALALDGHISISANGQINPASGAPGDVVYVTVMSLPSPSAGTFAEQPAEEQPAGDQPRATPPATEGGVVAPQGAGELGSAPGAEAPQAAPGSDGGTPGIQATTTSPQPPMQPEAGAEVVTAPPVETDQPPAAPPLTIEGDELGPAGETPVGDLETAPVEVPPVDALPDGVPEVPAPDAPVIGSSAPHPPVEHVDEIELTEPPLDPPVFADGGQVDSPVPLPDQPGQDAPPVTPPPAEQPGAEAAAPVDASPVVSETPTPEAQQAPTDPPQAPSAEVTPPAESTLVVPADAPAPGDVVPDAVQTPDATVAPDAQPAPADSAAPQQ